MQGLIVGVDPGTTTAWAVFDLHGKELYIGSKRGIGKNELVRILHSHGKVHAIGCDKQKTPGLVEEISRKFGCKVICPKEDMPRQRKAELADGLSGLNQHEFDAAASGRYAYLQMQKLLLKIHKTARDEGEDFETLANAVLSSGLSIQNAILDINRIEEMRQIPERAATLPATPTLFLEMNSLRKDNARLKKTLEGLLIWKADASKEMEKLRLELKNRPKIKHEDKLMLKNRELESLRNKARMMSTIGRSAVEKQRALERDLLNISNMIICRKMENLGTKEFTRINDIRPIRMGEVLFVCRPQEMSAEVVMTLRKTGVIIATRSKIDKKLRDELGVSIVDISEIKTREYLGITLFNKSQFEMAKRRGKLIEEIVTEYQKERASYP